MANNDRVTKDPSPSWIADNKSTNKPLATKSTNGTIGWSDEEKTRNLLSRNAFNTPGWRNKIVIPPGMATINYDDTLFKVLDETTGLDVPSGGYVKLGINIRVILQEQIGYQYGCYASIVNGSVTAKEFLKNFTGPGDTSTEPPNSTVLLVVGNVQIVGEARKRAKVNIGADLPNVITATLEVNSWGNKGHQVKTMQLAPTLGDPDDMEFYVGDEVKFTIAVASPYHWCNFRFNRGTNTTMYPVNKSEVTYTDNGGIYTTTMTEDTLFLAMGGIQPIQFYLYQQGSSYFSKVKVRVQKQATNLDIYRQVGQPSVGTNILYGKNGTAGNHVPLYAGMTVRITITDSGTYVASNAVISYDSLSPTIPTPTDFSYVNPCDIVIGSQANNTGKICIGLRYLKTKMAGNQCFVKNSNTQDTDTFKNFMDALWELQQTQTSDYFTEKYHRVTDIASANKYQSTTQAIKLALVDPNDFSESFRWEYEQQGVFQKGNYNQAFGGTYFLENGVARAEGINVGPFTTQSRCFIVEGKLSKASNGDDIYTITCVCDGINVKISPPTGDWFVPGSTTQYIPYDTLVEQWGDEPWTVNSNFYITPYFVAITRSA